MMETTEPSPKLMVRLELDPNGQPIFNEREGHRHYRVVFEVENAPADTYAATFELDPTYYDPVRTLSPDDSGRLSLKTTTYGDYPVLVRLRRKGAEDVILREGLARALRREIGSSARTEAIGEAISSISEN